MRVLRVSVFIGVLLRRSSSLAKRACFLRINLPSNLSQTSKTL